MKRALLFAALAACTICGQEPDHKIPSWQIPEPIKRCLSSLGPLAKTPLVLNWAINPYYLRGDFDGDGHADLAIALKSRNNDSTLGTGICREGHPPPLLGAIAKGQPFSEDPADSIASVGWAVAGRAVVMQILRKAILQDTTRQALGYDWQPRKER